MYFYPIISGEAIWLHGEWGEKSALLEGLESSFHLLHFLTCFVREL